MAVGLPLRYPLYRMNSFTLYTVCQHIVSMCDCHVELNLLLTYILIIQQRQWRDTLCYHLQCNSWTSSPDDATRCLQVT